MYIWLRFIIVLLISLAIGFGSYMLVVLILGDMEVKYYPATFVGATAGLLSFDWLFKVKIVLKYDDSDDETN